MSEAATAPTATTPATTAPSPAETAAPVSVLTPAATTESTAPAAPVPAGVPENYEFTPRAGDGKFAQIDAVALDGFKATAKEAGLTQDQFAKLAPYGAQIIAEKMQAAAQAALPEHLQPATQQAWVDEIKADAEYGGAKFETTVVNAAKAIDAFGGAELRKALDVLHGGNNPTLIKAFAAIGKAMGDTDGLMTGRPAAGAKPATREQGARNYFNNAGGSYAPVEN